MPMVRQPLILAICPTHDPTAPAAVETTTVSPAFGWPISSSAKYAVRPFSPRIAERGGNRQPRPGDFALDCVDVYRRVVLPAKHAGHVLAAMDVGVPRLLDAPDGTGPHHGAKCHRLRIVGHGADPTAHRRLDGQIDIAHENLAIRKVGHRRLDDLEVLRIGNARWPRFQPDLAIDVNGPSRSQRQTTLLQRQRPVRIRPEDQIPTCRSRCSPTSAAFAPA